MSIERERYGRFGIASYSVLCPTGSWGLAWGCVGDAIADTVLREPAEPTWFTYGDTREEAVAKLKAELDQVSA